jgi:hypothetical protein
VPRLLECGGEFFFYGPNVGSAPIEQINISSGARNFLVSDPTGVREGINSSGNVFGTMSYDSYGNPCTSCTSFSVFGFEGGYTDRNCSGPRPDLRA